MLIIKGDLEKLKNSEFYDKDCWDYPKEEIDMLKEHENYSNGVYLTAEDRVYETLCDIQDFDKLLEKVNGEILYSSREELINILNSEKAIKVCGKSNYTPTDFLKIDDKVFFRNKHIGTEKIWYEHPNTVDELLNHLENMQKEGAVIRIISDKEYFKPFKDPEENFYVTNDPNQFNYMEYKGFRTCYIEDTNTIVIHKIIPNEEESYTDYDETIINRNYTEDNLKRIIDTEYIKENTNDEENEEYQI